MTLSPKPTLLDDVANYYTEKLITYGEGPKGVDWNGEEGQVLRFEQLCKVIDRPHGFSVNDLGCGYGALADFLVTRFDAVAYAGFDVSDAMVQSARARSRERSGPHLTPRFVRAAEPDEPADFGIASGIFNVKLGRSHAEWNAYVESTLDALDRTSTNGFSFNCLTSYSDADRMRPDLHYADPLQMFDHCKRRYSRHVALLHDYALYEFTILVRKLR